MNISDKDFELYEKTISVERLKSFAQHNRNISTIDDLKEN